MISVIMSCYKSHKPFLRDSIESILFQTYKDFELLVANNGVDFDLQAFLADFKDDRIKYIDNGGNIGPTASYDNLARIAKGEYIAIQDHDDYSQFQRLEIEKAALDENPELMSVSGLIHIFGGGREYFDGVSMKPEQVKEELIFWQPIKQPTFMKRKSFCERYKYNPEWMIYDYEFWSRTRHEPHKILPNILLDYRKSNLNTSKERTRKIRQEHARLVQRNLAALGIDAPIELCAALDPYNHNKADKHILDLFISYKKKLLKHISAELYERKLKEIKLKTP